MHTEGKRDQDSEMAVGITGGGKNLRVNWAKVRNMQLGDW
jgi:hypothetical protein